MLGLMQKLCTLPLRVEEQMALFQEMNAMPLSGEVLAELATYFYSFLPKRNEVPIKALDLVGTGGDGKGTFNISTTVALYLAAQGIPIAKHGSVSVSSRSGSVDCLHALKIHCAENYDEAMRQLKREGRTFLFARDFYPLLAQFREARLNLRERGERTIINLLGPLINPLNPQHQVIGVYDPKLLRPMAEAMQLLGRSGFVVTSEGTDELTLSPEHQVLEVTDQKIEPRQFNLEALGFHYADISELKGGDPQENAMITRGILDGTIWGPKREVVLLNAFLGERAYYGA